MKSLILPDLRPKQTNTEAEDLAFTIKQLQHLLALAEANGEWYAVAITKYTLAYLGAEYAHNQN